jgi:hypothetical protein
VEARDSFLTASQGSPSCSRSEYRPPGEVEEQLDGLTHGSLALAIFIPVAATYGAIAYGLYLASDAIF